MKKLFSTILVALVATVASYAQTIALVSSSGTTTMYQDFGKAVNEAKDGSTIYLPGGGFQLNDTIRIKHKVTIMGVSHRADTDNAEGATIIAGNVWFNQGADGSALMGVYVSGNVFIGEDAHVDNILVRFCNVNTVSIKNSECTGTTINQNYLRGELQGGASNATVTNNIAHSVRDVNGGTVDHNIFLHSTYGYSYRINYYYGMVSVTNSTITNNIVKEMAYYACDNSQFYHNLTGGELEEGDDWTKVFKDHSKDISVLSNFHLLSPYASGDNSEYGVYGGTGFDDEALAPIPRIISKEIPEQTDAEGKLNIKITVKSGSKSGNGSSGNGGAGGGSTSW